MCCWSTGEGQRIEHRRRGPGRRRRVLQPAALWLHGEEGTGPAVEGGFQMWIVVQAMGRKPHDQVRLGERRRQRFAREGACEGQRQDRGGGVERQRCPEARGGRGRIVGGVRHDQAGLAWPEPTRLQLMAVEVDELGRDVGPGRHALVGHRVCVEVGAARSRLVGNQVRPSARSTTHSR